MTTDQFTIDFTDPISRPAAPLDVIHGDGMTMDEAAVLRVLRGHVGREAAIQVEAIAAETGVSGRKVQQIVRHLIEHHGQLIGTASSAPYGNYIMSDPDEIDEVVRSLRHRGIAVLVRASIISKTSVETVFGQARLELAASGK